MSKIPCQNPKLCGVKNHRQGTVAACMKSGKKSSASSQPLIARMTPKLPDLNHSAGYALFAPKIPSFSEPEYDCFSREAKKSGLPLIAEGEESRYQMLQDAWDKGYRPIMLRSVEPGSVLLSYNSLMEGKYTKADGHKVSEIYEDDESGSVIVKFKDDEEDWWMDPYAPMLCHEKGLPRFTNFPEGFIGG